MNSLQRAAKVVPKVSSLALQTRSVVAGAPRGKKLSKVERIVLPTIMIASFFAIPSWVMYNLKYYNGTAQK